MKKQKDSTIGGIILIAVGAFALLSQFVEMETFGLLFLPGLGAMFLLWGILSRSHGLMIPGGILSGIGWGSLLIVSGPLQNASETTQGGVFMLVFALGWAVITLFSAIFAGRPQWWALIPGAIMAIIGGAVLAGGIFTEALTLLGKLWPLALIVIGLYVIIQGLRPNKAG